MKHPKLAVEKRTILGKKIKNLRKEGILPANIYGKDLASVAVQVPLQDFINLYKEVGETGLIDIELDGTKRPVLIKNVQFEFRYHTPLHADFYQVNLKEKVKTMVPLEFVGEAPAVVEKLGDLIHPLNEVEVEALPESLPENIEVSLESLTAVDTQITVNDLKVEKEVTILTDPEQIIAKITEIVEEPEPEAVEETEAPAETSGDTPEQTTDANASEEKTE